jgi:hypothetical protein
MKLENIIELWEEDTNINSSELGEEALKIPKLHSKYYQIYIKEKLMLRKYEADLGGLRLNKTEFYMYGPSSQEQIDLGWKLPASGKVLKSDLPKYVDADNDVIEQTLKIGLQKEKVDFLDSIIKSLTARGFNIRASIDWEKFKMGV